ncbi:MAG: hypothetical protein AAFR61_04170 [Bacteroidota bacterium]
MKKIINLLLLSCLCLTPLWSVAQLEASAEAAWFEALEEGDKKKKDDKKKKKKKDEDKKKGPKGWKIGYMKKLMRVSARVSYGIGQFESYMSYELPDISEDVNAVAQQLGATYAWVPWDKVQLQPTNLKREKSQRNLGQFYSNTGINLPIFFLDVETSIGRFSEPLIQFDEVWPPWKKANKEDMAYLLIKRAINPDAKGMINLKIGLESERLLPDHLQPRIRFGDVQVGLDVMAYYLIGADLSYNVGLEVINGNAQEHLMDVFEGVPLITNRMKEDAAQAIISQVESRLPSYFWPPALQGFGLGGKVYVDVGKRFRLAARYQSERTQGIKLETPEYSLQGPTVYRHFFSIGIESQL